MSAAANWVTALDAYQYRVSVPTYPGRDAVLRDGDRRATIALEDWFRDTRYGSLEPWITVAYWKLGSQGGRARHHTQRLERQLSDRGIGASQLSDLLTEVGKSPSREQFGAFRRALFPASPVVAVAWTFVAFLDPERFPMVDTRVAKWAIEHASQISTSSGPITPPRYGQTSATVLTMADYPFLEWWVGWCQAHAHRLTQATGRAWRARDVEMAVYSASGLELELDLAI